MSELAHMKYTIGTLEYTKRSLMILFMWLLWGDFCFQLMEIIEPSVLPIVLKGLGASNLIISMYVTTIAAGFNVIVNPMASFMSDRYRSRWGRRIPFLAFATPFVGLFLVLTGFCREIGHFFFTHFFHHTTTSEAALTIGVIGILVVAYQFFNYIIASVYYYLFNDVVPVEYLGRILAWFRAIGSAAGMLYQFFVYQYAASHSKEIFLGFGLLYFVGFMAMCLKVKEGQYPPPPEKDKSGNAVWASIKTFFKESFCHKFYLYFYLSFGFWAVATTVYPFMVFRNLNIGLTLKELGNLNGVVAGVTMLLLIPAGYYVDKKHPIRVGLTAMIWTLIFVPANIVFLWHWSHPVTLTLTIVITALTTPVGIVLFAAELPMFMRLLPHSRFGQMCSAMAMLRGAMTIVAGIICGLFLDGLKWYCQRRLHIGGDYYYRLMFIWSMVFTAVAVLCRVKLYKMWLKLGGDDDYLPPVFEADEIEFRNSFHSKNEPEGEQTSSLVLNGHKSAAEAMKTAAKQINDAISETLEISPALKARYERSTRRQGR